MIPHFFHQALQSEPILWTAAVAIPRRIFDLVGGFWGTPPFTGEDSDLWMRIAAQYDIAYSSRCTAIYYSDPSRGTGRTYDPTVLTPIWGRGRKLVEDAQIREYERHDFETFLAKLALSCVGWRIRKGNPHAARELLAKCHPVHGLRWRWALWGALSYLPTAWVSAAYDLYTR